MTEGHGGGHFKLILALVLIAGIMGLIAYANIGQQFLKAFKIGGFANVQQQPTEPFGISLTTGATALYGKSFSIVGAPFSFEGICSLVKVGTFSITPSETRCSASAESFTGTFQYSPFGSVIFVGSADVIKFNSNEISPETKGTQVPFEFEVIPTDFFVAGISADKISLVAPSGKIEKYTKDGQIAVVAFLKQNTLDLNSLIANAQLENGELKVTGTATSVKSEEFSW